MTLRMLRVRGSALKNKWPAYASLIDFYVAVREAQDRSRAETNPSWKSINGKNAAKTESSEETLNAAQSVVIDSDAAERLFGELCRIGIEANDNFKRSVNDIQAGISAGSIVLSELLEMEPTNSTPERSSAEPDTVLAFLIQESIRPSLEVARRAFASTPNDGDARAADQCPFCGALSSTNILKGDPAERFAHCSNCGCQWKIGWFTCARCGEDAKGGRNFLQPDEPSIHRIDLCQTCGGYTKTIDLRENDGIDPDLEDLATSHLDAIAVQRGYKRAAPNKWTE